MFFRLAYNFFLHLFALTMLPKVFFSWAKYGPSFKARLGIGFPRVDKKNQKLIWVHAVSLGETKAISPLLNQLKEWNPSFKILFSSTTQTGFLEGKKKVAADWHVFLPFDFPYIIRPIVKRVAPDFVILSETDFWFHFQDAAKKRGAKLIVVNGKLSKSSYLRLSLFSSFAKHLLSPLDQCFLQGEIYKKRFEKLRVDSKKLVVTGNIKLDGQEPAKVRQNLRQVLTLGSTHAPEEEIWLAALKTLWKKFPDLKVRLAPRHPERFEEVARLLEKHKISFGRYSKGELLMNYPMLLVDEMGVLRELYRESKLAFVGGSFTSKVGGHNILEPCFYGVPVLYGPYMHSQPDFLDLMTEFGAGTQLTKETIIPTIEKLLSFPEVCERLGDNGLKLIQSSRGAQQKTFNYLKNILAAC